MSDDWTTVNGSSGGRRNGKNKYQSQASRGLQPTTRIKGEPIRMEQKLAELSVENQWFDRALSEPLKQQLVQAVVALLERHIAEMASTSFFRTVYAQLQEARARIQKQLNASLAISSSIAAIISATAVSPSDKLFDIVIYGIGRFAEYAPPAHLRDDLPTAASLTTPSAAPSPFPNNIDAFSVSNVRSSIRTSSRPAQIQMALIVAVLRALQKEEAVQESATHSSLTTISSSVPGSSSSSSFQVHLYDPMLSSLEKAVAQAMGMHSIPENEEGCRPLQANSLPTLFYMPHCPQTLYNNVLWSNWDLRLTKVFVMGNSFNKYYTKLNAASALSQTASNASSSSSSSSGYYRAGNGRGKKKRSDFAQKLAQDPICCDHHDEPHPSETSAEDLTVAPTAPVTTSSTSSSSPYPCLQAIGPILVEQEVLNTHESQTVFNDLNLHTFEPDQSLLQLLVQKSNVKEGAETSEAIAAKYQSFFTQFPRVSFGAASSSASDQTANDTEIIPATLTKNV